MVESISTRYERVTGKSPSADVLTSSLDELLKTLKNKFGKQSGADTMAKKPEPYEALQMLLASRGMMNASPNVQESNSSG